VLKFECADGNKVIVTGEGMEVLRFKSELFARIPMCEIENSSNNSFRMTLEDFVTVHHELASTSIVDPALTSLAQILRTEELEYTSSLTRFHEFLNLGIPSAEDPYWSEILKPHQLIAAEAMGIEGLRGVCLFDEQGVGKTLTTIASFDLLRKQNSVEALLVVAPKTLMKTWADEFEQFLPSSYTIVEISGNKLERLRKIQTQADVYISTFDGAANDASLLSTLLRSRSFLLTVDESFFAKNPQAKRSSSLIKLRGFATKAFVLCGTPAPNKPTDIIQQVNISDNGFAFRNFVADDDVSIAAHQIREILDTRAAIIRRTKDEVLPDLPTKHVEVIKVSLEESQRNLYESARKDLVLYLQRIDNKTFKRNLATYFQKRAALLQICISPSLIGHMDKSSAKYIALSNLVESLIEVQGKKVVIWSAYTRSTDQIAVLLQKYGLVRIDGTITNSSERNLAIKRFQEDPDIRIFLGNAAAAGAGITLTAADCAIYVSFSNQAAHYMQSLDRIHRIGQTAHQVTYYFLIASETIEENEIQMIWRKQKAQSDLLGDLQNDRFNRELALAELGMGFE
jgi:SNF2 family DNA or RNA helicase